MTHSNPLIFVFSVVIGLYWILPAAMTSNHDYINRN